MTLQAEQYYSRAFQELHDKAVTEGRAEGRAEGQVKGTARAVLRVLERRGLAVSEEQGTLITGTSDQEQVDDWLDRAVTADTTEELFE